MLIRSRWAAIGAAIAVSLGAAGGIGLVVATDTSKPVVVTVAPERVLDTRVDLGLTGPFVSETPRELTVTGSVPVASGGSKIVVPDGASGVLANVTVILPTDFGHLSLRPGGSTGEPSTATVNFTAASVEPNAATVDLGPGGTVQIFLKTASPTGSAHVVLDIVGYTIDHDHDDRYYTESEVNTKIAAIPAWDTIPSGMTVSGPVRWDEESAVASGDYRFFVSFPAVAPAQPSSANWAPDLSSATIDDDSECTGTASNPTAPPGKVCMYWQSSNLASSLQGRVFPDLLNRGFEIWWNVTGTGDLFVNGTWAYTAP